jgi:dynein light chain LC8-type
MSSDTTAGAAHTAEESKSLTAKSHRITIKSVDMADDKKNAIIEMAEEALEKLDMEKDVAEHLKRHCDTAYGNTWHCVVGKK